MRLFAEAVTVGGLVVGVEFSDFGGVPKPTTVVISSRQPGPMMWQRVNEAGSMLGPPGAVGPADIRDLRLGGIFDRMLRQRAEQVRIMATEKRDSESPGDRELVAEWAEQHVETAAARASKGRRPGRPPYYSDDDRAKVVQVVTTEPKGRWTAKIIEVLGADPRHRGISAKSVEKLIRQARNKGRLPGPVTTDEITKGANDECS